MVGCETRGREEEVTHAISLQPTTVHTYALQNLLHFHDEACSKTIRERPVIVIRAHTRMKHRPRQLDMTEMTRTLRHTLSARLTLEVPIDRTQTRVHQTSNLGFMGRFVHDFRMFDLCDRVGFLSRNRGESGTRA